MLPGPYPDAVRRDSASAGVDGSIVFAVREGRPPDDRETVPRALLRVCKRNMLRGGNRIYTSKNPAEAQQRLRSTTAAR